MNAQPVGHKAKAFKPRNLIFCFLLILVATACTPQSQAPTPTATPQPASQTGTENHTPVIRKVVERTGTKDGQTIIYEDITFTDGDGDATTIVDETVWVNQRATTSNVGILASPNEQREGVTVTDEWGCGPDLLRVVETRILDKAGNLSEPVTITISCPRSQLPDILPFLIAAVGIGLGLLLGAWLLLRKRPSERKSVFQSLLLLFCLLFPLYFTYLILHEGGHALVTLTHGGMVEILYVHPFSYVGYNMLPFDWNSALYHAGGLMLVLPVSLVIFILFWKRRSVSNLPFVMLFPWTAIMQGLRILTAGGDFSTIVYLTGLPIPLFIVTGFLIVGIGILLLVSLLPLFGLVPADRKSLFVLPTALFLWAALGMMAAYLFVPGTPIDAQYRLTREIFNSAISFLIAGPIIGALLAVLYLKLYPKLPAGLRTETVNLTWKDLQLPALLAAICVTLGLIVIT